MRTTRGSLALALLLAFGSAVPLRADDTAQKQAAATDGTLPIEVETDLREQIGELEAEIAQLKTEMADMKALEAKDKAAFDARMAAEDAKLAQLQRQQGAVGRVGQVNGEIQQGTAGNRTNPGGTNTTGANNNTGANNGNGTANNTANNGNGQNKPLGFWEKLLLKVVQGAGQALSKWLDKKLGLIQTNASNASNRLGQRYPSYSNQIDNRINQAVNNAWNGNPNAENGQTVIVQQSQSQTVVVQNGQVTQVTQTNTTSTTTVRQFDRLPVVTDEFGTHPILNMTLGDD